MTRLYFKLYFTLPVFCFFIFSKAGAQSLSFSNLNTSNGLSENNVQSVVVGKKGFLWIGTTDGLNVYDGYSITTYKKKTQPEIASNNIIHMTCDSKDRIWLGTFDGITWIDENRKFHKVILNDSVSKILVSKVLKEIDETLSGPDFFRIRNSYLIKLNHIKKYVRGEGGYIIMDDGTNISMSGSRRQEFMDQFSKF